MPVVTSPARRRASAAASRAAKSCDLCGSSSFEPISERDRRGGTLATGICRRCGLVCHMTIPSDQELADFYARRYRQEYHGETTPSARRVMRAWKNADRIYRQLAPHVARSASVFEVGAGIGCNVKMFQLHGHDASGIEPNEGFCRFSIEKLKTPLVQADLFDRPCGEPSPDPSYDLVLLIHVIEHFNSPRRALERMHRLVAPGGKLYVECPNLAAPFARWGKTFHFAHVHNFTPSSLRMMGLRCGFEVERVFSRPDDPNLQMLFHRVAAGRLEVDLENHRRTLADLNKYNTITYHLRPRYLAQRAGKLAGYVSEHLSARRRLRQLIDRCQHAGHTTCKD